MDTLGKQSIAILLQMFLPEATLLEAKPITQGLINNSYSIKTTQGAFLLQRINTHVFKAPLPLMENIISFQKLKAPKTYKSPLFIKNPIGEYLIKDRTGGLWRMQEFMTETIAYDLAPKLSIAEEAGRLLGEFHQISQTANIKNFHSPLVGFQDIFLRLDQFDLAFKKADTKSLKIAKNALATVYELRKFVSDIPKDLPCRLCHNDTKLNNMLFSATTKKGLCLIDLDTLMPGYAFYDFGDAFRTIANKASEGDLKTPAAFRKRYAYAFIKGLSKYAQNYTEAEWKSFAFGAVYMPFIHGLRALTDYLEGNKYYKVRYANENLDRSESLFNFAKVSYTQQTYILRKLAIHIK